MSMKNWRADRELGDINVAERTSDYSPEHEQVAGLLKQAKAIVKAADIAGRDLSDADSAKIKSLIDEIALLKASDGYMLAERDKLNAWAATQNFDEDVEVHPLIPGVSHANSSRRRLGGGTWKAGRYFRDMFGDRFGGGMLSSDGFKSFGDYLTVLSSSRFDRRMRPAASMLEGTDSKGGFLVPTEYAAMMLDAALEKEIVRPRAMVHPMKSDTLKIAGFDNLDHSAHLFGGLVATWEQEGATKTATDAKVRQIQLTAKKLFMLTQSSNELVQDGQDFERTLGEALIGGISWYMDHAFLRGTGSGQPLGVLNDPALITVSAEAGQTANTVWYANVSKMLSRLHPACFATAVWVANPSVIPELLEMFPGDDGSGSPSIQYPAFQEAAGKFTLFGKEVLFTEKLPALGTVGDIILADFGQYSLALRPEVGVEKSIHPGFTSDTSYFRCIVRCDGQGRWSQPLTPANGDSLSWCIALAARAG